METYAHPPPHLLLLQTHLKGFILILVWIEKLETFFFGGGGAGVGGVELMKWDYSSPAAVIPTLS